MTNTALALALLSCGIAGLATPGNAGPQRARATDARTISITVSVVDSKGDPVTGLTAADFRVREDNVTREVLEAGPNTTPMQIAILVDDSQAAGNGIAPMREGLTEFVDALQGKAEMAIITVGERPTSVVQYTPSAEALKKGINRIFARPGSGAYLLEAISESSRGLAKREAARPIIVALTFEGIEFGSGHHDQILSELYGSKAALHVLAIGSPGSMSSEEMRNRNMVIAEGTERTGGRRDQLLSVQAIPDRLEQLAAELANQYTVTYARPDALIPPERVRVSTANPTLTVRAATTPVSER